MTSPKAAKLAKLQLTTPISGEALALAMHPDPAISHGLQGQGVCISPLGSRVIAPCDAIVTHKSATNHQLTLQAAHGLIVELTFGSEAIATHGLGFSSHLTTGQRVKCGDTLIELDLLSLKKTIPNLCFALLVSNGVVKTSPQYGAVRANEDIVLTSIIKLKDTTKGTS